MNKFIARELAFFIAPLTFFAGIQRMKHLGRAVFFLVAGIGIMTATWDAFSLKPIGWRWVMVFVGLVCTLGPALALCQDETEDSQS
ncbi:hypothetical protein [Pulveribacter sp.]|uniref:hypothetical protein n=1 Tax=Pulveribacter sp. TaxID=2678893 RepID=UPI0028AA0C97|nr:hypothetical protein [Pulveribacter sp.]